MAVITTLDVYGQTPEEYRAIMDELGVEKRAEPGIYLHVTTRTDFGFRIIEIWDEKEGFDRFLETRLTPAAEKLGMNSEIKITVTPLHNLFGPRLDELPDLVSSLPGRPGSNGI
ncbi:hypothetical protein [Nocardia brevicatena]|uniref:hypothetical protein n=1 Tax=Nocardia brevicatena TaxID=37327 RepID=UPI000312D2D1|nr:hypothetical protein [Nocardia brevicatena]